MCMSMEVGYGWVAMVTSLLLRRLLHIHVPSDTFKVLTIHLICKFLIVSFSDLSYNIALCFYSLKQYAPALKHIADIIERGIREHPG